MGKWLARFFGKKPQENPEKVEDEEINDQTVLLKRIISHNVRMPMTVISGYGELLKQGLLREDEKEKCIKSICDNIFYMNQILKIVLDEESDGILRPEPIDVVELVGMMKNYVDTIAKKIPIIISIESSEPHIQIFAETIPIMKVLYQLFDNAFKYLRPGNRILIKIYSVDEANTIIVFKDDGCGVPAEEIPSIFDKNFRASNSRAKNGTGFGLYEVKNVIESYGGTISASGDINKGLSIVMMLPTGKKSLENL